MNKHNAKQYLPLVQALADGKTLQYNSGSESSPVWIERKSYEFGFHPDFYRIKPEPREWKAVVILDCEKNRKLNRFIGQLVGYDHGDENLSEYEVIRVREILD